MPSVSQTHPLLCSQLPEYCVSVPVSPVAPATRRSRVESESWRSVSRWICSLPVRFFICRALLLALSLLHTEYTKIRAMESGIGGTSAATQRPALPCLRAAVLQE